MSKKRFRLNLVTDNEMYPGSDCEIIGEISDEKQEYTITLVRKGKDINNGYSMGVLKQDEVIIIYLDPFYQDLLINKTDIAVALIYHEIGHVINGDFNGNGNPKENCALRTALIQQGIVQPKELNADKYAASIVGTKQMRKALNYLLEYRKKNKTQVIFLNREAAELGIRELELRINALK